MITGKDLTIGSKVYVVSANSAPEIITVKKITNCTDPYTGNNMIRIIYSNDCVGHIYPNDTSSGMGYYACTVFFNKEDAIEFYRKKITEITEYISQLSK